MSNAARVSDAVSHGGSVATGSADVLTDGLESARLGDLVKCAVHGAAVIAQSSATVLVNGRGFARLGDGCVCAGGGAAGPGNKDLVLFILSVHGSGKTFDEIVAETRGHGPHLEGILKDANRDGVLDSLSLKGGLAGFKLEGKYGSFGMETFSAEGELAVVRGPNASHGPGIVPLNTTVKARGEVAALKTDGTVNLGQEASVTFKGSLFKAGAEGEVLAGDDGRRVGVVLKGGAKASAVAGGATGTVNTTAGGLLGKLAVASPTFAAAALGTRAVAALSPSVARALATPVKIETSAGASAASVGIDGGVEAFYDRETEQAVFGLEGELAALLGLGVDLKLTVGADASSEGATPGGGGPNVIAAGSGTVLVGG